ncbi:MAG TPA: AMP-binding protein [Gaiellaceae bacterium]
MTYHSTDDLRRGLALREARYLSFAGVGHAMPRVTFGGRSIETQRRRAGPFHRVNLAERQIYFSVYHLSAETVPEYVRILRRHKPRWLTGYASTIADLARLADAQSLECPPLSAVITAAESVPSHLRETAPRIFGCEVTEEYGLAEESCFALECEQHSLHVSPDAGVVEIVDANGDRCAPGSPGDIVATGLVREAQPLIRYRTGDRGSWSAKACGCGREMPVIESLDGRSDDAVLTPDGRQVTRLTAVARGLREVAYMQFVQEQPDCLEVHVVAEGPLTTNLQEEIVRRLQERLGSEMNISVHRRDAPIRTSRGKVRAVISRLEAIPS